jgi:hypothetical protein
VANVELEEGELVESETDDGDQVLDLSTGRRDQNMRYILPVDSGTVDMANVIHDVNALNGQYDWSMAVLDGNGGVRRLMRAVNGDETNQIKHAIPEVQICSFDVIHIRLLV